MTARRQTVFYASRYSLSRTKAINELMVSVRNDFTSDTMGVMNVHIKNAAAMKAWGKKLGSQVLGGEVIELQGDVGAGKTTMVKGIGSGLGIDEDIQSPTFTISRLYHARDELLLAHYDFYRLDDPGILAMQLEEATHDPQTVTIIEWGGVVKGVLPKDRLTISIKAPSDNQRDMVLKATGPKSKSLMEKLA